MAVLLNYSRHSESLVNDNLAEYLNAYFSKLIENYNEKIPLSSISHYVTTKETYGTLENKVYISTENILPDRQGIGFFGDTTDDERITHFKLGDILVSNIRPYFKKMWFCTITGGCNSDVLCIRANSPIYRYFIKSVIYQNEFFTYIMSGTKGTKMPRGDKKHIMQYLVPKIPTARLIKFNNLAKNIESTQSKNRVEIEYLNEMQNILLANLSRR